MKWRALILIIVFAAGVATGYLAAQPDLRDKVHESVMTYGALIEKQVTQLLQQVQGKETPVPAPSAPPPLHTSVITPVAPPEVVADYLRAFVQVSEIDAVREEASTAVIVSGKLINSGTRTLEKVEATVYFMGEEDIVFDTKLALVTSEPLPPNSAKEFSWRIPTVPLAWAGKIRSTVTTIRFQNTAE